MLCSEKSLENGKRLKCTRCGKCECEPLIIRNKCGDLQMNEDVALNGHKIIYEKLHKYAKTGLTPNEINLYVKCQAQSVNKRELRLGLEVNRMQRKLDFRDETIEELAELITEITNHNNCLLNTDCNKNQNCFRCYVDKIKEIINKE